MLCLKHKARNNKANKLIAKPKKRKIPKAKKIAIYMFKNINTTA